MSNLFWLTDEQFASVEGASPMNRPRVKPRRNREIISGILHVLKTGCRWEDCPAEYAPHTTVYNRFNRWSKKGIWAEILGKLVVHDATNLQCIDSTTAKTHRCARVEKGAETQTIGRNRGGRTTKIHAVADRAGRLIGFALTPGQRGDIRVAQALLAS